MSNYKRLTDEDWLTTISVNDTNDTKLVEYAFRLWQLENQIKNGTLVDLPCKIGDTVYTVDYDDDQDDWVINEVRIRWFIVGADGVHPYDLGYRHFYTKDKAKEKLKELRGGSNDYIN